MDEDFDEVAQAKQNASKLAEVRELVSMPGWKTVMDHFTQVIAVTTDALGEEENFRKIRQLQERRRAFKAMLETVAALCEQHSEAVARLDSLVQQQQERDQYGQD